MFSAFFATYAVLTDSTAGGPTGRDLFDLRTVAIETALPADVELHLRPGRHRSARAQRALFYGAMAVTFLLGVAFLALELREFATWSHEAPARAAAPSCRRSSLWSAATGCT